MITLSSGYEMPAMGFGTSGINVVEPYINAIKNGFRHIDTAKKYDNEHVIGEALKTAIEGGLVKREELFITTKLWHDNYDSPEDALRLGLQKLQTDYVDLYLIHWPHNGQVENKVPMHVLWAKMEALVEKGLCRSIGVSNFNIQLMSDMLTYAKIPPAVNQVQIYPECAQPELVSWMQENKITPVAYSPCGRTGASHLNTEDSVNSAVIKELALKYEATPVQILLAFGLSRGYAVIPKAASSGHQLDNFNAQKFKLDESEVKQIIDTLDKHRLIFQAAEDFAPINMFV